MEYGVMKVLLINQEYNNGNGMFPLISVSSHQYAEHTICIGYIHLLAMQHLGHIWR